AGPLFNENEFNDIHLDIDPFDGNEIITRQGDTGRYRMGTWHWKDVTLEQIGVKRAQENYPATPKESLHLKFNAFKSHNWFLGLKELKLNGNVKDLSMIRDRVTFGVMRSVIPASRSVHCRLFINGEYWGVYEVEERIEGDMAWQHYGGQE